MTSYVGRLRYWTGSECGIATADGVQWFAVPTLREEAYAALSHEVIAYAEDGVLRRLCVQLVLEALR